MVGTPPLRRLLVTTVTVLLAALWSCSPRRADASIVRVAVAANFAATLDALAEEFERATGFRVAVSAASTGKLDAQIRHGAPFHAFLAADTARPAALERDGLAVPGSRFNYARGRLALIRADGRPIRSLAAELQDPVPERIAIANPTTAPYGAAAHAVLERLGLLDALQGQFARGENISQTLQFVTSGGADVGFVALAHVCGPDGPPHLTIPEDLHEPIEQAAVLLAAGAGHEPARAFLAFLASDEARRTIRAAGYSTR